MEKKYMGIDQYGKTYHGLVHPRKDLSEQTGCKHIQKLFVDSKDGKTYQTGYVVGPYWINVYEVIPMRKEIR